MFVRCKCPYIYSSTLAIRKAPQLHEHSKRTCFLKFCYADLKSSLHSIADLVVFVFLLKQQEEEQQEQEQEPHQNADTTRSARKVKFGVQSYLTLTTRYTNKKWGQLSPPPFQQSLALTHIFLLKLAIRYYCKRGTVPKWVDVFF